jgi:hypothetical protein
MFEHRKPGSKVDHLVWSVTQPEPGGRLRGWICGEQFGCDTHHVNGTKPCKKVLTNGAMDCQWCATGIRVGYTSWVPWFDELGRKCISLVGREMEGYVSSLILGTAITISKRKAANAPVLITATDWFSAPCPFIRRLKCWYDIRPFLMGLWGDKQLVEFYGSDPVMRPITEEERRTKNADHMSPTDFSGVKDILKNRLTKWEVEIEATDSDAPHDRKAPSKNGSHKGHK